MWLASWIILIGPFRSHVDQTLEYYYVWLRAIDDRKARVPASRAGYHKQTKSENPGFIGNWANWALMAQSCGLYT